MIEVAGFEQSTKNYARTFQPTISRDAYIAGQVQQTMSESAMSALFAAFVDTTADEALIDDLSEKLAKRKKNWNPKNKKGGLMLTFYSFLLERFYQQYFMLILHFLYKNNKIIVKFDPAILMVLPFFPLSSKHR